MLQGDEHGFRRPYLRKLLIRGPRPSWLQVSVAIVTGGGDGRDL